MRQFVGILEHDGLYDYELF